MSVCVRETITKTDTEPTALPVPTTLTILENPACFLLLEIPVHSQNITYAESCGKAPSNAHRHLEVHPGPVYVRSAHLPCRAAPQGTVQASHAPVGIQVL